MYIENCWHVLGIEPTNDRRAIKKAYAKNLKLIDPDKEIEKFLNLRQALQDCERNSATIGAEYQDEEIISNVAKDEYKNPPKTNFSEQGFKHSEDEENLEEQGKAEFWKKQNEDTVYDDNENLENNAKSEFWTAKDPPPDQLESAAKKELENHRHVITSALIAAENGERYDDNNHDIWDDMLDDLLKSPYMQNLLYQIETSNWLMETLLRFRPHSDPMILKASEFFEWETDDATLQKNNSTAIISKIIYDLRVEKALRETEHIWHIAYTILTDPSHKIAHKYYFSQSKQLGELINSLRQYNPKLLEKIDPDYLEKCVKLSQSNIINNNQSEGAISWYGLAWIIFIFITIGTILQGFNEL